MNTTRTTTSTDRIVLAYSGGLDTSVAIGWLADQTGAEVVAVAIDVGQGGEDLETVRKRALGCGAVEAVVVDARDEFADDFCLPALRANAMYMDRYPLVSALSRPLIARHLVQAASEYGATVVLFGLFWLQSTSTLPCRSAFFMSLTTRSGWSASMPESSTPTVMSRLP